MQQGLLQENAQHNSSFFYLKNFTSEKIHELENKYGKSAPELEQLIGGHPKTFYFYLTSHILANYGSNLLYIKFAVEAGGRGILQALKVFLSNINISPTFVASVGIPAAITDVFAYTLFYSVWEAAVTDSLNFILRDSIFVRAKNWFRTFAGAPIKTGLGLIRTAFNEMVLKVTNVTGCLSELIYFYSGMPFWSRWLVTPVVGWFGDLYYGQYTDWEYQNWWQQFAKNYFPIFSKHYLSTSFEITLQFLSAVILRTYPLFYRIAVETKEALHYWPDPRFVAFCVAIHSMKTALNATVVPHMEARNEIHKILSEDLEFKATILQNFGLQPGESMSKQEYLHSINKILASYKKQLMAEKGRTYFLRKNIGSVIYVITRCLVGAMLFYGLNAFIENLPLAKFISYALPILGTLGLGLPLYYAELNRQVSQEFLRFLQYQRRQQFGLSELPQNNKSSPFVLFFACLFTFVSAFMTSMTIIGTLSAKSSDFLKALVVLLCIERMMNSIQFNFPKIEDTIRGLFFSAKYCSARLFQPKLPEPVDVEMNLVERLGPSFA